MFLRWFVHLWQFVSSNLGTEWIVTVVYCTKWLKWPHIYTYRIGSIGSPSTSRHINVVQEDVSSHVLEMLHEMLHENRYIVGIDDVKSTQTKIVCGKGKLQVLGDKMEMITSQLSRIIIGSLKCQLLQYKEGGFATVSWTTFWGIIDHKSQCFQVHSVTCCDLSIVLS